MTGELDRVVNLRLTQEALDRIDALIPQIERDPAYEAFSPLSRGAALRLALHAGLQLLEERYRNPRR